MTAHTPGPWDSRGTAGSERHGQHVVYAQDGKDIAIVYDGDKNARLIAAAPVMLEALEDVLGMLNHGTPNPHSRHIDAIRSALAAAQEGGK